MTRDIFIITTHHTIYYGNILFIITTHYLL